MVSELASSPLTVSSSQLPITDPNDLDSRLSSGQSPKEIQERDAKLKVVGSSAKSKPHLDVNAQDDEEEDQDQQGPAEDSPTLNRVRSLERQGE